MKGTKAQPATAANDDIAWRQFPKFEEILGSDEPAPLLAKVEKTCRQLDGLMQSGSESDRARAKLAMAAYGRSLDLLRQLTDMRNRSGIQK